MERQAFLDRARQHLTIAHHNVAHPIPAFEGVPPIDLDLDLHDLPAAFERAAAAHSAVTRRASDPTGLADVLAEIVAEHDIRRVALSSDPEVEAVRPYLDGLELVTPRSPQDLEDVDLGITGVSWAIAASSTLVVDSARAGARSVSLIPPVHLAIVPMSRLVATTSDVWRQVPERFPHGLPSNLVFISGPSKSADIEFTLTVGVHGPKHVWMCLLEDTE